MHGIFSHGNVSIILVQFFIPNVALFFFNEQILSTAQHVLLTFFGVGRFLMKRRVSKIFVCIILNIDLKTTSVLTSDVQSKTN